MVTVSPDQNDTKRKAGASTSNSVAFPQEFNVKNKWGHINYVHPYVSVNLDSDGMSRSIAYQCINARGAIAHGKKVESFFHNDCVTKASGHKAKAILSKFGLVKRLESVEAIKEELMNCGPVVSTSFKPNALFLRENSIGKSNKCWQSDILVIGWQQQARGDFWIVQPLSNNPFIPPTAAYVAIGHFCLDDCCLAPKSNLENYTWQSGPYFDYDMSGVEMEWQTWSTMECTVVSIDNVFKQVGSVDISSGKGTIVTLRDKNKKAHSRKGTLQSIKWSAAECRFKVSLAFI